MTNKDQTIKNIVDHLQNKFGSSNILIQDYWEEDNFAIGLTDKTKKFLTYISTFGLESNKFYIA
ncbi:MAG: hypothetical protein ACM3H8_09060, partial [Sphingobacteriales bacterium]